MSEHTKEPWLILPVARNHSLIMTKQLKEVVSNWINTPDARRIVACVNACAGITTDVLESTTISEFWQKTMLDKHKADFGVSELRAEVDFLEAELSQYRWLIDQEWPVILDCYHQHPDRFKERIIAKMAEESKCQE